MQSDVPKEYGGQSCVAWLGNTGAREGAGSDGLGR